MKETIVFAATLLETLAVSFLYWSDMALQEDAKEKKPAQPIETKIPIKQPQNSPMLPLPVKKKSLVKTHLQQKRNLY